MEDAAFDERHGIETRKRFGPGGRHKSPGRLHGHDDDRVLDASKETEWERVASEQRGCQSNVSKSKHENIHVETDPKSHTRTPRNYS